MFAIASIVAAAASAGWWWCCCCSHCHRPRSWSLLLLLLRFQLFYNRRCVAVSYRFGAVFFALFSFLLIFYICYMYQISSDTIDFERYMWLMLLPHSSFVVVCFKINYKYAFAWIENFPQLVSMGNRHAYFNVDFYHFVQCCSVLFLFGSALFISIVTLFRENCTHTDTHSN